MKDEDGLSTPARSPEGTFNILRSRCEVGQTSKNNQFGRHHSHVRPATATLPSDLSPGLATPTMPLSPVRLAATEYDNLLLASFLFLPPPNPGDDLRTLSCLSSQELLPGDIPFLSRGRLPLLGSKGDLSLNKEDDPASKEKADPPGGKKWLPSA